MSIFADMTYEGARGSIGSYLALLGAGAATVAFVVGFGEFLGYTPRLLTGSIADRSSRYWGLMFVGYGINLFAVPMLAISGCWLSASLLVVVERVGKAIRAPVRDAIISHASANVGRGWSFGVHEAMSSIGGIVGPVLMAVAFMMTGTYTTGFMLLALPALVSLLLLARAFRLYPAPRVLESMPAASGQRLPRGFWTFTLGASLVGAGFMDFPFISYHLEGVMIGGVLISILYAMANVSDALGALGLGRLFDAKGMRVLIWSTLATSVFPLLVFTGDMHLLILGMVLWGLGAGIQESIMRAAVSQIAPANRRGSAFGLFSMCFGIFWFIGALVMGLLYEHSIVMVVAFSMIIQVVGVLHLHLAAGQMKAAHVIVEQTEAA